MGVKKRPEAEHGEAPQDGHAQEQERPPRLRLEYVEAGSLTPNQRNWRRHSRHQLDLLEEALTDPDVGWAGALLFNERTGRLIDGHARQKVVRPTDLVPVLIGNWSEEAERRILLTLDPIGSAADPDSDIFGELLSETTFPGETLEDFVHRLALGEEEAGDADGAGAGEVSDEEARYPLTPMFGERYDYVVIVTKQETDFVWLQEVLGVERVNARRQKAVGVGRVITVERFRERWMSRS